MPPLQYTLYMLFLRYNFKATMAKDDEEKVVIVGPKKRFSVWHFGQLADLILFYYHMDNPLILPTTTANNVISFVKKYDPNTMYNRVKNRVREVFKKVQKVVKKMNVSS